MKRIIIILFVLWTGSGAVAFSQNERYVVKRSSFSSKVTDEFSPVYYREGIVFCSNINDNSLVSYKDDQGRFFKLFYVASRGGSGWKQPVILARELTSGFNDGPATFNRAGNIIFFNRNNITGRDAKKLTDSTNKLGIFYSVMINGKWTEVTAFPYNNPEYVFATPALSPDGKRLYFASDKPGGYGGMDLYYCDSLSAGWSVPVNMGPVINTNGNESFPYADKSGRLFFSSDSLGGLGGKDLYYTFLTDGNWFSPVHLEAPLNSPFDDFGIVTDSTIANGFFSTNRNKTDDIMTFSTLPLEFESCDTLKENRYCYTLYDEHYFTDTIPVEYVWDFGDGVINKGREVRHCFPGPGRYNVVLNIFDALTRDTITKGADYEVVLEENDMPYIKSGNLTLTDKSMTFSGVVSGLKNFNISDFYWDFGDGFRPGGPVMEHTFSKSGEYIVKLGLISARYDAGEISRQCVEKKIRIYDSFEADQVSEPSESTSPGMNSLNGTESYMHFGNYTYFAGDLSSRQKSRIISSLKGTRMSVIGYGKTGFDEPSRVFLQKITDILKENKNLRIEMAVYLYNADNDDVRMELSEMCAQELAFWFRNSNISSARYGARGMGTSESSLIKSGVPVSDQKKGFIEFVFTDQ